MKLIYQADIHLRDTAPANRTDNYVETGFRKLKQLVDFANDHDAHLLLGGDLYDSHRASHELVNRAHDILDGVWKEIFSCLGQHDVPYHDVDVRKSPLYSMMKSRTITAAADGIEELGHDTRIHFVSWEKSPQRPIPGKFNILLGHISVFAGSVPGYWKGEGYTPETLREKYPGFQLYLCGDIHAPTVDKNVVVSGAMLRAEILHIHAKPRCYLIDTETMEITPLYYDIEEDVFTVPTKKVQAALELDHMVSAMRTANIGKASFKRDCLALSSSEGNEEVQKIIVEIFDGINSNS